MYEHSVTGCCACKVATQHEHYLLSAAGQTSLQADDALREPSLTPPLTLAVIVVAVGKSQWEVMNGQQIAQSTDSIHMYLVVVLTGCHDSCRQLANCQ